MFESLDKAGRWWVDGLADIVLAMARDGGGATGWRIAQGALGWDVTDPNGEPAGRIELGDDGARAVPADLLARLRGQAVTILVPAGWVFRRKLDPLAAASAPYVEAFVRHHIERVTPWKTADTYFGVATAPMPGDPGRIAVELGVVPKQLLGGIAEIARAAEPRRLIVAAEDGDGFEIALASDDGVRAGRARKVAGAVLATLLVAAVGLIGAASWYSTIAGAELADVERQIDDRKAFLAAAADRSRPKLDPAANLRRARLEAPLAVVMLDAVSAALPDQAYVTEFRLERDTLRISGIARDVSELIPLLEASPALRNVAFFAPTTRMPTGEGDRFAIEAKAERPAPGPRTPGAGTTMGLPPGAATVLPVATPVGATTGVTTTGAGAPPAPAARLP
jgi:general secretion pathway protein L